MRDTAKTASVAPSSDRAIGLGFVRRAVALTALSLAAVLSSAVPSSAAVVTDRPLLFSFDGGDTTAGAFLGNENLDVNQATGDVYVVDSSNGAVVRHVIDKFNASGEAQPFAATGESSLQIPFGGTIAIDNSAANPGRIYLRGRLAFDPAGNRLWELKNTGCGVAVDTEGHMWVGDENAGRVREFDNVGSPPAEIGGFTPQAPPCHLGFDSSGNVYVQRSTGGGRYRIDKYVGGAFSSILDPLDTADVAVNQSTTLPSPGLAGHIFTVHASVSEGFDEYDSTGALVGHFGKGVVTNGHGIAYNHALDRVYVADSSRVRAFGPKVTGTVPDVTSEAATAIGISKAEFNGKVNPQSVPNSYFFEWKQGTAVTSWGEARSSAPQPLAEDSTDHSVSFSASELNGNTTYQVRLVGLNTANGLRAFSAPVTFKTATAAAVPALTIGNATAVTTTTAVLHATVNPKEDFGTTYRFQISTDPACATGFVDRLRRSPESEANSPVAVEEAISGLLPSQRYCVRIVAENSAGTATPATNTFETLIKAPSEAETAFVAPRADTTARLNGRIDPEGEVLTYRFEWSEDGGATWTALPDQQDTSEARRQIVVAEELSGLEPDTTYSYRFRAENPAGPVAPQGEEKAFTTRTSAEVHSPSPCPNEDVRAARHTTYLGDCRGIELVNNPDKGDQHVRLEVLQGTPVIDPDGEKAIWNVLAGAPGGNVGSGATFLAERTGSGESAPNGWSSRALIPPPAQQPGGGEAGGWNLGVTTPDLSAFVFDAGVPPANLLGTTLFAVDANQNQLALAKYSVPITPRRVDLSDGGAHVLFIDPAPPHQLQDLSATPPETVSLMPNGQPNECGLDVSDENRSFVGSGNNPEAAAVQWRPGYHMIATTDGSRVYFEAKPNGAACETTLYGIYERNRETEETTLIDPGAAEASPQFIRATPDGREAYFLTYSKLDPADANSDPDVYRWNEESGESRCLTCVVSDANIAFVKLGGGGGGIVLVSDDFSHVYFESREQLVSGEGKAGDLNVYSLSNGEIRFVADPNGSGAVLQEALLSQDGGVLAFATSSDAVSHQGLTADRVASCGPGACGELYRYDERDASVECLSCRRGGLTDHRMGAEGSVVGNDFRMSADGETVAFVTSEALAPLDVNGSSDIYEARNGVLHLISDGVTAYPVSFFASPQVRAVSADGANIFFTLVDPTLTGFEQDGFASLYDARIGGGFEPSIRPAHCSEESCQGPLQPAPALDQIASSGTSRGNAESPPTPAPCRKGKVRRHGRCVRLRHLHKKRHGRAGHASRGGSK